MIKECVDQFESGFGQIQKELNKLFDESQISELLDFISAFKKYKEDIEWNMQ